MEFPVNLDNLRDCLLDKISVPYLSNKAKTSVKSKNMPVGGSSPNLTDLKLKAKLYPSEQHDRSIYANPSFANVRHPRRENLAIDIPNSKSFADLPRQLGCPSPASSISSKDSYYDYTQINPTYTSSVRCKLARNEPIASHYYNEHMERYGKPPFVWGVRKPTDYEDFNRSRKSSSRFDF